MNTIEAIDPVTAGATGAFVAMCGVVIKIIAARPLQYITADGRHIADLPRGATKYRLGQHGEALAHRAVFGKRHVFRRCANQQATVLAGLDGIREGGHIDEHFRSLNSLTHEIDEIGAPSEILGICMFAEKTRRRFRVRRLLILELNHRFASSAKVARTASTIPL